jgi:nucleolar protein 56
MAAWALATRWFGVLLLEDGEPVAEELFPARAEAIADRLERLRDGEVLEEERRLVADVDEVRVADERLADLDGTRLDPSVATPVSAEDEGRDPSLRREAAIQLSETAIEGQLSDPTRHLVQAVSYLDESHDIENRMVERLVAWVRLQAPGLVDEVEDGRELARRVARRDAAEVGLGSTLDPNEHRALTGLATSIVQQVEAREPLERFVAELARDVAPNVAQLTTPAIAARLIQHAGSLEELAKQPASTIQMLGAERAVFQHLTEGAPPPKHGVIYRHPMIHEAHPSDRGSIARAVAAKIAIAARADAFTGNDVAGELAAELNSRVDDIQREGRRRAKREAGS